MLSLRTLLRHPIQFSIMTLGIALGVAVMVGIDIANQMLELGRGKIAEKGLSDIISLETGDSEQLRFNNNSFDA